MRRTSEKLNDAKKEKRQNKIEQMETNIEFNG